MRTGYARVTEKACEYCTAPFEARLSELARGAGRFCSRACKYAASRGRSKITARCENPACGVLFQREAYLTRRPTRLFCCLKCSAAVITREERAERGRRGGSAPHRDPGREVKVARSRLGGLARAARQSLERLREIGRLGVQARRAGPATRRRQAARRAARTQGKTLRWFGVPIS